MSDGPNIEQRLLRAARRILRPLVRIMLRNGIASDAFTELVRKVYVDVADEEFRLPGKKQTVSRISVITGLNRKEVTRLRGEPAEDSSDERWRNRAATVLSAWELDPMFQDRKGDPLDLPFAGEPPNLTELVRKHSGDMQPRAVVDELLRVGAIEELPSATYRMARRGYEPSADAGAMVDMLGTDTSEFIETIDHNVQNTADDSLMQAKVLYMNVPAELEQEFLTLSRRQARKLVNELNHWLAERDRGTEPDRGEGRRTLGLGIYHINRTSPYDQSAADDEPGSTDA
ncbi:MAG: DUF6502 family protein [Pseudomonadota bacterium]